MVCHQAVNILHPFKLANSVEVLFKNLIPQVIDLQSHEILNVYFSLPVQSKAKKYAGPCEGSNVLTYIRDRDIPSAVRPFQQSANMNR